jgi:hypothetical protein
MTQQLQFDTAFPGGNGHNFARAGERHYAFEADLRGGERGLWFYFQAEGGAGEIVTFDVVNGRKLLGWPLFEGMRPVFGGPGRWQRTELAAQVLRDEGIVRFSMPCRAGDFIAFCYPYTLRELDAFRQAHMEGGVIREVELMRSPADHPIYAWEAGSGPKGVWLTCRNHAGESPASYVLEGFMLELTEPHNRLLLEQATVRACPMVDVDNVESGGYGKYGPLCDPYMDWSDRPQLEPVAALQRYFAVAAERPTVYIDLHSPEPCGSTFACTWAENQVSAAYLQSVNELCRAIYEQSGHPLRLDLARTKGYPQWFGDAIDRSSQGYFRTRYGCPALTLEVSYHWSSGRPYPEPNDYHEFGRALCRAVQKTSVV